jgi:guanylate kinase
MQGKLCIFSAPSGSGKTTIVKHLLGLDLGLEFSVSATSRKPRENEQEGVDYYFLSPEAFRNKIANNAFLEWEEVYENQYYGTLRSEVQRLRAAGKHVVFDIDVEGGLNLKKEFKQEALAVFIRPPSIETLENRLRQRATETEDQLKKRLDKARKELLSAEKFDHVIFNDDLNTALKETEKVVRDFINFVP